MSLPTTTKALILQNAPLTTPDLTLSATSTFALKEIPIEPLKEGDILIQNIFLSNDPAQRGWMQKGSDPKRMYTEPVVEGQVMKSGGIGRVISSKTDTAKEGQLVFGLVGWREYSVVPAKSVSPVNPIPNVSPSIFLGMLGLTGLTAYVGVYEILKLKQGESIVVSGAAGAVGTIVVQIAKHLVGASKVVAIAGTDEKVEYLKTIGADIGINYKSPSFKEDLLAATEGFVDTYFDNVGGETLDIMFTRVKRNGRIAACGAISTYNGAGTNIKNWLDVITQRLTIQGFVIVDYMHKLGECVATLSKGIQEGKIKAEGSETLVKAPFEDVPKVWGRLFEGANQGKLVTQIADL